MNLVLCVTRLSRADPRPTGSTVRPLSFLGRIQFDRQPNIPAVLCFSVVL